MATESELKQGDDHAGPAPSQPDPPDPRNLNAGDDHAGTTRLSPSATSAGHEPDVVDVKSILIVPAIVVVFCVLTYVTVSIIFGVVTRPEVPSATAHPQAVTRNAANLNERLGRVSSTDPNAEVRQPRLEYLKVQEFDPTLPGGDPPYLRSRPDAKTGNSPEYHPEDLRADWVPELNQTAWLDRDRGVARIPIGQAMKAVVGQLPIAPKGQQSDPNAVPTAQRPKASNSGRGPVAAGTGLQTEPKGGAPAAGTGKGNH